VKKNQKYSRKKSEGIPNQSNNGDPAADAFLKNLDVVRDLSAAILTVLAAASRYATNFNNTPITSDGTLPVKLFGKRLNLKCQAEKRGESNLF